MPKASAPSSVFCETQSGVLVAVRGALLHLLVVVSHHAPSFFWAEMMSASISSMTRAAVESDTSRFTRSQAAFGADVETRISKDG